MSNFQVSNEKGKEGEEVVGALLTIEGRQWIRTPHTEYERLNLDFESDFYLQDIDSFVEVKCLKGGYDTACIEKYKNKENPYWCNIKGRYLGLDNQKDVKYPGWMRTILAGKDLEVYILNKKDSTVYIFDGRKLYNYVQAYQDGGLSVPLDGNIDNSGWLALFGWTDKKVGFMRKAKIKGGLK